MAAGGEVLFESAMAYYGLRKPSIKLGRLRLWLKLVVVGGSNWCDEWSSCGLVD